MAFIRVRLAGPSRAGRWALVLVSGALGLWGVPAARAQCPPSFAAAVDYGAGSSPFSVAIGDFNADGRPDLAATNFNGANVSVLLGNGNGTFAAPVNYTAGINPRSVAIGDLNGDNRLDLAVANQGSANVSVLLGNGSGTFAAAIDYSVGVNPSSVAIGDLNGDGRPDLAVANFSSNSVSVLLGNGNGTFVAPVNYASGANPRAVAIGDVSGDGRPDLAVANQGSNNVSVLLGNGNGTFAAAVNYAAGNNPYSVAIGDVSGDGRPDLAVANLSGNNVSVLLGNGPPNTGTFGAAVNYAAGSGPLFVAIGDVSGDGRPDLAVANTFSDNVSVLSGNGNGSFAAPVNFATPDSSSVAIGDINADGKPDLAVANSNSNTVSVLLNSGAQAAISQQPADRTVTEGFSVSFTVAATGATSFQWRRNGIPLINSAPYSGVTTSTLALTNASIAAAGSYDVQIIGGCSPVLSRSATLFVMPPSCASSFAAAVNYAAGSSPFSVAIGDVSGDGRPDLAVANSNSNTVSVLLGNGPPNTGTFAAAVNYAAGGGPFSVAIGDVSGDGRPDLAVANLSSNIVSVLLGNGDGTFGAPANYAAGTNPRTVAIGDVNGDGRPDLAVANQGSNNVSVLLGNGPPNTGTFAAAVNYAAGNNPFSVAIGDLNGDGTPELAVANLNSNTVSVLLGNGAGAFAAAVNYAVGSSPFSVTIGDFNADGRPDLAVANQGSNNVSVLLGNGPPNTGTFGAAVNYAAGVQPNSVAVGDVNGDGKPDLAVANNGGSNVSVLVGNGNGTFGAPVNYGAGTNPRSVAIGDVSGDGKLDLAVANSTSNNVSVLLNNGPSISMSQQPQSQSVAVGANVVLSAGATGTGPLTYQWRKNGVPIGGATSSTLAISGVTAASAGAYDVQVRGGCNPTAVVTSSPAVLNVRGCNPADISTVGSPDPFSGADGFLTGEDFDAFIILFFQGC